MEFLKKNAVLLIAIALPLLFVLGVAIFVIVSRGKSLTQYDFVYATCQSNERIPYTPYERVCPSDAFDVTNGKVTIDAEALDQEVNDGDHPRKVHYDYRLFVHESTKNESREVTLEEAQALVLDDRLTSPDGVTIGDGYLGGSSGPFPFDGSSSHYSAYAEKGKRRQELHLLDVSDNGYYGGGDMFHFIGWVKK